MDSRRRTAAALAACAVGAVLAVSPPARADVGVFGDPAGDATSVDVTRVRVVHRDAVTVRVRSAVPVATGQVYTFWISTGRGWRPTYRVAFRANSGFDDALGLVGSFGERPSRFVRCRGMRAHADIFDDAPVSLRVPRRCLGDPRRVRVAVKFADETTGSTDWAPQRRTFTDWVAR